MYFMCGIGGFCINPKDKSRIDTDHLAAMLLLALEVRGTHATGQAWYDGKRVVTRKAAVSANVWVKRGEHKCAAPVRVLHTRFATQGTPNNPVNNHPIRTGPVTGTHNGVLSNDDALFDLLGCNRIGQVDSEAIFALLAHGGLPIREALPMVMGRAAVAWFDERDKTHALHLARISDSPLCVGQTRSGSFVYASTHEILTRACEDARVRLVWQQSVPEGTYMRVVDGVITATELFTPPAAGLYTPRRRDQVHLSSKRKAKSNKKRAVYTQPIQPADWEWDDADVLADRLARDEEALVFGE